MFLYKIGSRRQTEMGENLRQPSSQSVLMPKQRINCLIVCGHHATVSTWLCVNDVTYLFIKAVNLTKKCNKVKDKLFVIEVRRKMILIEVPMSEMCIKEPKAKIQSGNLCHLKLTLKRTHLQQMMFFRLFFFFFLYFCIQNIFSCPILCLDYFQHRFP